MRQLAIFIIAVLLLPACNSNTTTRTSKSEAAQLKEKVLAMHDSTMDMMGIISELKMGLDSAMTNATDTMPIHNASVGLSKSHDLMMDWMHNFHDPMKNDSISEQAKVSYLKAQVAQLDSVEQIMRDNIEKAGELVRK